MKYIGIEELKDIYRYIKNGTKNYLRYLSWPNEKISISTWVVYLSFLAMNISVVMGFVSIFMLPIMTMLFALTGAISTFVCLTQVLPHGRLFD